MHTRFFWDSPPAADFNNHISWTQLDKHRFAATRIRIVCVQTETAYDFHGPGLDTAAISSASTARKFTYKCELIVTRSTTISDTIRKALTDRVLNQSTLRITIGNNAPLLVGRVQLSSELIVDEGHEVTRTSEETLSQVTSYSLQSADGESVEINVGFKEGRTIAELRRRCKQVTWDVYGYSCDYLQLEYDPGWFWQKIKRSIQTSRSTQIGSPLGRVIFYVPQIYPDVVWRGEYIAALDSPDSIEVVPLTKPMPNHPTVPALEGLTS